MVPVYRLKSLLQLTVSDVSLDFFPFSNTVLWGLHGLASDAILWAILFAALGRQGRCEFPFGWGKKITMSKGRRVAERRLWEHTDGEWPASICAAVHVPRKFCRSFSESYPDIPGRKQKRHLGSRAGSDEWWQIGSTVAIAGPPGNLSLGRQDNRSLV